MRNARVSAAMREAQGMPDLEIFLADGSVPGEVKAISVGSTLNTVNGAVRKANSQIKCADPSGSGIVFIRLIRSELSTAPDGQLPDDVATYKGMCERVLSGGVNRSVGVIIVLWDDLIIAGPSHSRTFAFRRNSVIIEHPAPRRKIALPALVQFGQTQTIRISKHAISYLPPPPPPGPPRLL